MKVTGIVKIFDNLRLQLKLQWLSIPQMNLMYIGFLIIALGIRHFPKMH